MWPVNLPVLWGSRGTPEAYVRSGGLTWNAGRYSDICNAHILFVVQGRISEVETARLEYDRARQRLAEAHKHALKAAAKNDAQGGIQNDVTIRQAEGALTGKSLHLLASANTSEAPPQTHAFDQHAGHVSESCTMSECGHARGLSALFSLCVMCHLRWPYPGATPCTAHDLAGSTRAAVSPHVRNRPLPSHVTRQECKRRTSQTPISDRKP